MGINIAGCLRHLPFLATMLFTLWFSSSSTAQTIGMVADDTTFSVTVFNPDTGTVLGSILIPGTLIGDVVITPDQTRGFVSNFAHQVYVIDLTTSPPALASGTNPIPTSNLGEDLAITPDGNFLLVVDGYGGIPPEPISVIDINARAEVSTLNTGTDNTSIDVCDDGTVLVGSFSSNVVRRLAMDASGFLSTTGDQLSVDSPMNVYCAPGSGAGVVVSAGAGGVTSFLLPALSQVDYRPVGFSMTGAINNAGDRVFVHTATPSAISVFEFDSNSGTLGESPLNTIDVGMVYNYLGMDQIANHPYANTLYVSEPGALNIYQPETGELLGSITDSFIVHPTGVTIRGVLSPVQQLNNLVDMVAALVNPHPSINGLKGPLNAVKVSLAKGKSRSAINQLRAFIHQVEARVRNGRLSEEDGSDLINSANQLIQTIKTG